MDITKAIGKKPIDTSRIKTKTLIQKIHQHRYLYLMIMPGILCYVVFEYFPMYGITLAFKDFAYKKGITGSPWVGLDNFRFVFRDMGFWRSVKNTLYMSLGKLLFCFPVPIIFTLLLNELRSKRLKRFFQQILYVPHFFSWVITAGLIFSLFSASTGSINRFLVNELGLKALHILGNPKAFRPLIFISSIWKESGWGTIIYLAAISSINPEIYESAIIDGANRFQRAIYITLPSLKYAISILLILNVGQMMEAGFMQVFNLYNPQTYVVGDIIDTYVYRMGILNAKFEFSTAIGLFKAVINCILLFTSNRIVKLMEGTTLI